MGSFLKAMLGGMAAGVGFVVGAAGVMALGSGSRPLAKRVMRGYLQAVERAKEKAAELAETLEDLYAEAKAERDAEMRAAQEQR